MQTAALFRKASKSWTWQAQMIKLLEEMGELQQAAGKYLLKQSGKANLCEEIADVEIMCHQMRIVLGLNERVQRWKALKLKRLERRLK
jgi:NTP pyrophosphatase (non-canonical NTP hydrolase)